MFLSFHVYCTSVNNTYTRPSLTLDSAQTYNVKVSKMVGDFTISVTHLFGCRSEKLKPFWLLLSNEDLSTFHNLSNALFSREQTTEYRDAVSAALDIKECKVVPFFGGFLKDLRYNLMCSPSIVVLPSDADHSIEVRGLLPGFSQVDGINSDGILFSFFKITNIDTVY